MRGRERPYRSPSSQRGTLAHRRGARPLYRLAVALAAVLSTTTLTCAVAFPTDSLDDGVCAAEEKACEGACVTRSDPAHGCASPSCVSCGIPNAQARCGATGACEFAACIGTFADCDQDKTNGCEVNTGFDPLSCGRCGHVCVARNGTPDCTNGVCVIQYCANGYSDCNGRADDGCEVAGPCPGGDGGP